MHNENSFLNLEEYEKIYFRHTLHELSNTFIIGGVRSFGDSIIEKEVEMLKYGIEYKNETINKLCYIHNLLAFANQYKDQLSNVCFYGTNLYGHKLTKKYLELYKEEVTKNFSQVIKVLDKSLSLRSYI